MITKNIQWSGPDEDDYIRSLNTFALGVYSYDQGCTPVKLWFKPHVGDFLCVGSFASIPVARLAAQNDFDNRVAELLSDAMVQSAFWGYERWPNDVPVGFGNTIERLREVRHNTRNIKELISR
jgi:hypothetical protein